MSALKFVDPVLYALRGACLFFNVLLSTWLAVTVVLNARQRNGPIVFAGLSLLSAAVFFTLYAAGLTAPLRLAGDWLDGPVGSFTLFVLLILPFAWFLIVLHYAGFREAVQAGRVNPWPVYGQITLVALLCPTAVFFAGVAIAGMIREIGSSAFFPYGMAAGIEMRIFLVVFGLYVLASTGFAFLTLRFFPAPELSVRGLARRRARRAMLRAGGMLLLLALFVNALVGLFFYSLGERGRPAAWYWSVLFRSDGIAAAMITFVIYYVGRAIVSYEIFSGTVLPERTLQRQWKNAVSFAGVFALFGGGLFFVTRAAMLAGLAGGVLGVLFLVRLGWRARHDRALHARALRPFLGSQDLYDTVLRGTGAETETEDESGVEGARVTFARFCKNVLEAKSAALVPGGSSVALIPRPLTYRRDEIPAVADAVLEGNCTRLAAGIEGRARFDSEADAAGNFMELDPRTHDGFIAALPLWSGLRQVGMLLLGEKLGGGVYTLEETEIAQAAGERLIDVLAAARLAGVLRDLERARRLDLGLRDERARRVLHDEILPEIHALLLRYGPGDDGAVRTLGAVHRRIAALLHEMPAAHPALDEGFVPALRRLSADALGVDRLVLDIAENAETTARDFSPVRTEVLYHAVREAIRNATRHARRPGRALEVLVRLEQNSEFRVIIEDNGKGEVENARDDLAAEPDAGQAGALEEPGAGQGLALHGAMLAVIGGELVFERGDAGARVVLRV